MHICTGITLPCGLASMNQFIMKYDSNVSWPDTLLVVRTDRASTLQVHVIWFLPSVVILRLFVLIRLNTCICVCRIEPYGKGTSTSH